MNKEKEIDFKFLKDEPIGKDSKGFFDFYHDSVSPALHSIINNETCVHTVGLFGRWGTGKSTIVKLLKEDSKENLQIIEFDCWKYEKDSLRRQLLLQIAKDLGLKRKEIDEIEKEFYFSISEKVSERTKISWSQVKRVGMYLTIPAIVILLFSWSIYPDLAKQWKEFLGMSLSLISASALFIWQFISSELKKIIMISPVTATKNQMNSPELFEKSFTRILKKAKSKNKVIIVIDNLDRVDSKVATEVLSTLKTFLEVSHTHIDGKNVIFIVPCDFEAIKKAAPSAELADEFLRKIFNVVVWTPEYYDTDIRTFIKAQVMQTGDIKKFLENDDVYLVIESAFANNPREIKQFINNLISSLVVAFNTEVKDIVQNDVAYMAKILVLMHKYPTAFQDLKKLWSTPEEINIIPDQNQKEEVQEKSKIDFESFMLKTSRITVDDAEPFIYLKKSVISNQLKDADQIRKTLIEGDETNVEKYIRSEKDKNVLSEFVISVLIKYQNQTTEIITKIFRTQLIVLDRLEISGIEYINKVATILDTKVWPSFQELPTDIVFSFVLSDKNLDKKVLTDILERYVISLNSTEEFKNFQNIKILIPIIRNLVEYQALLTQDQKADLIQSIEHLYSEREDVLSLFIEAQNKEKFITRKTLENFIQTLDINNFATRKNVIIGFSELVSRYKLIPLLLQKISELLSKYNQDTPDFDEKKELFLKNVLELIDVFESDLDQITIEDRPALIQILIKTFNDIRSWDNRATLMKAISYLEDIAPDNSKTELRLLMTQFLQNASPVVVEEFIKSWESEYVNGLISELLPQLKQRIVTESDFAKVIYLSADSETRLTILKNIIDGTPTRAIEFIGQLKQREYSRLAVARMCLEKVVALSDTERTAVYDFVVNIIKDKDELPLKDIATEQIKTLLNQDNDDNACAGFNFFVKAKFLSVEKKRDIIKSTLEFIRQPSKQITGQHKYALEAVTTFFKNLQTTPQKDYVYFLFGLLKESQSEEVIKMGLDNLLEIKPFYSDYQKDYRDLLTSLNSWPLKATKDLIVTTLLRLKPDGKVSVSEDKFWKEIEELKPE